MNPYMNKYTSLSVLLLLAGSAFAAGPAEWSQPAAEDLRAERLSGTAPVAPPSRHAESEPVSYAWPLSIDRSEPTPAGPSMTSRQYFVDTDGRRLEKGLKLPLSAPGAIVRISALHAGRGALLDAAGLEVNVDGRSRPMTQGGGGLELLSGRDLQAQGLSVPSDSLAFQLPKQGQPDSFQLRLAGAPADQALVVHVFEPESDWVAQLSAPRHNYLAGGEIELDIGLVNGEDRYAAQSIQAVLVSPDAAHDWPLEVTEDGFGLKGAAPLNLPEAGEGLYEVHAYVQGRQGDTLIRRDVKVAVSLAAPTARLSEDISSRDAAGLSVDLGVEVAQAGRYQVSGQVWGTAPDGSLKPLAMAQSAAVLEPGEGRLQLDVPADLLAGSALSAPFEVRELQLLDQGRMTVLESRSNGFTIGRDADSPRPPTKNIER